MATGRKTGGRRKGTPNKVTSAVRERLHSILDGITDRVMDDLEQVEPKARLQVYVRLLEFVIPKYRSIENRTLTTLEEFVLMSEEERQACIDEIRQHHA